MWVGVSDVEKWGLWLWLCLAVVAVMVTAEGLIVAREVVNIEKGFKIAVSKSACLRGGKYINMIFEGNNITMSPKSSLQSKSQLRRARQHFRRGTLTRNAPAAARLKLKRI